MITVGFALQIEWEVPGLPALVGPFSTVHEAEEWARLNIVNGTWELAQLSYPYYQVTHS